jgi:predicted RNA-binding protein with PUA domain
VPNQRAVSHLTAVARKKVLAALVADGMEVGAADLEVAWDARLCPAGNRGVAYVELKRPVDPKPVSPDQVRFVREMRALGFVAGWAQSLEQVEDLLVEAGAPLRFRILRPVLAQDE